MTTRQQRRKRQASGVEQISAFVYMPKFIAWLIWEGYLDQEATNLPPLEYRAAVTRALEQHLYRCYSPLAEPWQSPNLNKWPEYARVVVNWPGYAGGSLAQDIQNGESFPVVGVLEREGELVKRYGLSPGFVISRHKAALRSAIPPLPLHHPGRPGQSSPPYRSEYLEELYEPTYHHASDWYEAPDDYDEAPDDYDPEINVAKEYADMQEQDIADCFDSEGYETE
jgi:hypothetical protein